MLDVLVVGDANPDLVLRGDVRPRFGQAEQLLDAADLVLGGSAAITAAGCARLGLRTGLLAVVADDVFGRFTRDRLAERGVDLSALRTAAGLPTGLSVILSTAADRAILTLPGTIPALRPEDVTNAHLAGTRHLHVSSLFLQPALAAGLADVLARARARGVTTSLDTNWDPSGRWEGVRDLLAATDVFLPNAAELLAVTGLHDSPGPSDRDAHATRRSDEDTHPTGRSDGDIDPTRRSDEDTYSTRRSDEDTHPTRPSDEDAHSDRAGGGEPSRGRRAGLSRERSTGPGWAALKKDCESGLHDILDVAAARLVAAGTTVVLKDGARGGRAWWPGGSCAAPGLELDVVDTTGAGDSFDAGFLAGRLAGLSMVDSVRWAAVAGSLSTRAPGGTAAQATRDEVVSLSGR